MRMLVMAAWNASALCLKFHLPSVWLLPESVTELWVLSLSSNSHLAAGEAFTYLKLQPSAETWATQVTDWCKDRVDSGRRQMHSVLKPCFEECFLSPVALPSSAFCGMQACGRQLWRRWADMVLTWVKREMWLCSSVRKFVQQFTPEPGFSYLTLQNRDGGRNCRSGWVKDPGQLCVKG